MSGITIKKVESVRDLKRFIRFKYDLYKGNAYWCPPLDFDELRTLRKDKNPAFEYCEAEYWLAWRDGKIVGRVAGIINPRANKRWKEDLVRFGWIDFIDDREVATLLIETVSEWGKGKGMTGIHGPLGFSDMDNEGMLVEGFNEHCTLSSIYNYPYYPLFLEEMGFRKAADWIQFEFGIPPVIPDKMLRTAKLVEKKFGLRMMKVKRKKDLIPYGRKMFWMLNDAFDELYGFAAISEKQIEAYISQYFGFIRIEFVSVVLDPQDDVVGFGISMPSLTEALRKSGGRLFPFGFIHLLRAIRNNDKIDMYLVGVRPDYQQKGVAALIWKELHEAYIRYGVRKAYTNPQLDDNMKALTIWKNYDFRQTMRRRCWIRHWQELQ